MTFYLNKSKKLKLIDWDKKTGEIKITDKGSMFLDLEFSHFLIDRLYKDDEKLLKKIPELLIINKSHDFVEHMEWKRIVTVTGNTPEELERNLRESLEKARKEDEELEKKSHPN